MAVSSPRFAATALKWYLNFSIVVILVFMAVLPFLTLFVVGAIQENLGAPPLPLPTHFLVQARVTSINLESEDEPSEFRLRGEGIVEFPTKRALPWILMLGHNLLGLAAGLFILWNLRDILKSVTAGDPFLPRNARLVRNIGIVMVSASIVFPALEYGVSRLVLRDAEFDGLVLNPAFDFRLDLLFYGVVVLVLAEVFRRGSQLRREQSFTV